MRKSLFILIIVFTVPFFAGAKKLDSLKYTNYKELLLDWDNDIFLHYDYYYTQGAHIIFLNPALRKNPANHILFQLKNADYYYGLGIIQEIYTPKDINDTLLNLVDRPYSGTLFLRSFIVSVLPEKKLRFTNQLDLGILGPLSGAEDAQRIIHDWLDLGFPNGWDFQIKNRPYLNYNFLVEKGLISIPGIFDFTGNTQVRLGNIHDDLLLGATIRIGRINSLFKGYNLGNKSYTENRDFQIFAFANTSAVAVAYNATLMGGIIPPENNLFFKFNDIEHFIGELTAGVEITWKFAGLRAQETWKTAEFHGGENHGWGTVSLFFRF
jgi:hypothetical protein